MGNFSRHLTIIIFLISAFGSLRALSDPVMDRLVQEADLKAYSAFMDRFSRKFCGRGEEQKYFELLKQYRGEGLYIPYLQEENVDHRPIRKYLPWIREKAKWIKGLEKKLSSEPSFPHRTQSTKKLRQGIKKWLELRARQSMDLKRGSLANDLLNQKKAIRREFDALISKIPFLVSFRYPVDHFENRRNYELFKAKRNSSEELAANSLFFKRKILEDRTFNQSGGSSDLYIRTTLDTIKIRLNTSDSEISRNLIFDMLWAVDQIDRFLKEGKRGWRLRLRDWRVRTEGAIQFYESVLSGKRNESLLETRLAKTKLKDFVAKKHAAVYQYLSDQDLVTQALYVLDTILLNEVGPATVSNFLDRRDVAQVVINRLNHRIYSRLNEEVPFYSHLNKATKNKVSNLRWLNTLFREGEFSFTFFYIPSVVRVFCPDRSRRAEKFRSKNVRLAKGLLNEPMTNFKALRYFSRVSMVGKVDMSLIWDDYSRIKMEPGRQLERVSQLKRKYNKGDFLYLHRFENARGKDYDVVRIQGKNVVIPKSSKTARFYEYRNPDLFSFFRPKYDLK